MDSPLLALVLLAAVAAVPLLLRHRRAAAPDGVRVVARTALSKSSVVAVVVVGGRRLLLGAGEQGIALLADLDAVDGQPATALDLGTTSTTTTSTTSTTLPELVPASTPQGRTDVALPPLVAPDAALDALAGLDLGATSTAGPGIGLLDRLRAMTVRTPVQGRPLDVLLRR